MVFAIETLRQQMPIYNVKPPKEKKKHTPGNVRFCECPIGEMLK